MTHMKVTIVGLQYTELEKYLQKEFSDIEIVEKEPDFVLCYGGDGTLLYGEHHYPGVPKVMIRNSRVCHLCSDAARETILRAVLSGEYTMREFAKLKATAEGEEYIALNDIVLGHKAVNGTLRAKVYINGQQYGDEIFGDGVIASTPLGSTGYYQSVTSSNFQAGIGIAFNNTINTVSHLVVNDDHVLEVEVTRGPGLVAADNQEKYTELSTGQRVRIELADEVAHIIELPAEHSRFNVNTGADRVPLGYCQMCRKHYAE